MRKSRMFMALALAGLCFLTACAAPEDVKMNAQPQTRQFGEIAISSLVEGQPGCEISGKIPLTGVEAVDNTLMQWAMGQVDAFKQQAGDLPTMAGAPCSLTMEYQPIWYNTDTVTFYFKQYQDLLGAHGAYLLSTFTFNLESGQQTTLQDIFDPNTDYLAALSKLALQKLREQTESYDEYMASVGLMPKEENFAVFAPEPEGLRLFFSPYQVAPWAYGMPEVLIKWDELQNVLRAQYLPVDLRLTGSPKEEKLIALTFDDGPHPINTVKLLDGLKKRDVRCTFFLVGERAQEQKELIGRMVAEGHSIGNHTYSHRGLNGLSLSQVQEELNKADEAIEAVTGQKPKLLRPPFGFWEEEYTPFVGKTVVFWSIDPDDWGHRNTSYLVKHIVKNAHDGDIILLHDMLPTSVEAALQVIDQLQKDGFTFVTVDELMEKRLADANPSQSFRKLP